ncbi:arylsulfate sulfotransferase [Clostridium perfringens D str. JGS1721]|uniref:Arylsulfate sulfotransferase n=1 Tax=Clostridium perfringens D str. JGS1721 TaxID=488537 RepID=B1V6L7_CLOPF|nr:aryl-sulfate sulfotransferase [Clostridium perfringens]EDT70542.1 arylsulfate sulfotransferase [Clostridium perfringens D str. JGS1721]
MSKNKKLLSLLFLIVYILTLLSGCNINKKAILNNLEVSNVFIKDKLEQSQKTIVYSGITEDNYNLKEPKEGHKFVLLNVSVEVSDKSNNFNTNTLKLEIDGDSFKQIKKDDFLEEFGYSKLSKSIEKGNCDEGYIIFEIPDNKANTNYKSWILKDSSSNTEFNLSNVVITDNIPKFDTISQKQEKIDESILKKYKEDTYSFDDPCVINNPYGNAPLTSLALFKTDEESEITVKIKGKKEIDDITYTIDGFKTDHQIPIIGLYANKNNTVILTAKTKNDTSIEKKLKIKTKKIPESIKNKDLDLVKSKPKEMENGLTLIDDENRLLVDKSGNIRWYLTDINGEVIDTSGVEEVLSNGRLMLSTNSYEAFSSIYEVDWLGKVHWSYSGPKTAHHEAEELPNGNILYIANNELIELQRSNNDENTVVRSIPFGKLIKSPKKSLEVRSSESKEWAHMNSIEYIADTESILISLRNQHMVLMMKYPSLEIEWILSPSIEYYPDLKDKFLTPIGENFEWFYSQHDATMLPDLDNNPETEDILLFDNGAHRALPKEKSIQEENMYSRLVHYRINTNKKTVEQIFEFGKEKGLDFYSDIQSGAQYLNETGNYLGTFASGVLPTWSQTIQEKNKKEKSHIVEVNKNGDIVYQLDLNNLYRATRIKENILSQGYSELGSLASYNVEPQKPKETKFVETDGSLKFNINSIEENNGLLNVSGYAFIEDKPIKSNEIYLILESDKQKYNYKLLRNQTIIIPQETLGLSDTEITKYPNKQLGFKAKYLDLNELETGIYKVKLGVTVEDSNEMVTTETGYMYTKADTLTEKQEIYNETISKEFKSNKYTFDNPLIIDDPYKISPLTSIALFETTKPAKVSIKVHGKDEYSNIEHNFDNFETIHQIPIYGLYPNYTNKIDLTVEFEDGNKETKTFEIKTKKLPSDFQEIEVLEKDQSKMKDGLIFMMQVGRAENYPAAIDKNGDVRWYLSNKEIGSVGPIRRLSNGNLIINSDRLIKAPYYTDGFYEINLLGEIKAKYNVPEFHHDAIELPNGNFVALANNPNKEGVVEDYIVEINKNNEIVKSWDMQEILNINPAKANENYGKMGGTHDWLHLNAISYSEKDNALIVSSRHQDAVIKFNIDTNEVLWILGNPDINLPENLKNKVLKPTNEDFVYNYGQHAASELPNGDLMIFDNGNFKSKSKENLVEPNNNYSSVRRFKIDTDNMTVTETFEYGKEKGNELFAGYVGDIDYIDGNYLATFGGILKDNEGNSYDNPALMVQNINENVYGETRIIEISEDKVVFDVQIKNPKHKNSNTYRSELMTPYDKSDDNLNIIK